MKTFLILLLPLILLAQEPKIKQAWIVDGSGDTWSIIRFDSTCSITVVVVNEIGFTVGSFKNMQMVCKRHGRIYISNRDSCPGDFPPSVTLYYPEQE